MRTKLFLFTAALLALLFSDFAIAGSFGDSFPNSIELFRDNVDDEVTDLLADDDNIISRLRTIVIRVLYFLLLFWVIVDFIMNGFSAEKTLNGVLMGFLVALLNETYLIWTDGIYFFFEAGALGIQESVTGTSSKYFLSTYIRNMWDEIDFESVSILDGAYLLFTFFIFAIVKTLLLIVVYISEIWAVWGFSFAKLIGPLFIPFIIFPSTRPMFDKWLALLVSFCVFTFVVRVIGVLFAIFTSSMLNTSNFTETTDSGITLTASSPILLIVLVNGLVGIAMLIGAGKISSALAGGIGGSGFTNSSLRAGGGAARKLFAKLVV